MLVLSRKKNELLRLGDNITIKVVEIRNSSVRLGVEAPKNVTVHRGEVYERIQAALAAGEPAREIEDALDHRENLTRTTNGIPAACLPVELETKL